MWGLILTSFSSTRCKKTDISILVGSKPESLTDGQPVRQAGESWYSSQAERQRGETGWGPPGSRGVFSHSSVNYRTFAFPHSDSTWTTDNYLCHTCTETYARTHTTPLQCQTLHCIDQWGAVSSSYRLQCSLHQTELQKVLNCLN